MVPRTIQTNQRVRQLQEVLDEVRTQCNTVEVNLASVLEHKAEVSGSNSVMAEGRRSIAELQRESKKLLAEVSSKGRAAIKEDLNGGPDFCL